jgi:hypothetical protein
MSGERQKNQFQQQLLAFAQEGRSESPLACAEGTVPREANSMTERPTSSDRLMELICDPDNLDAALAKVIANGGAPGVDGMRVTELAKYVERHRERIIGELLAGTYRPQPVKRVEIPKPDGGVRKLGIPTAVDRLIQQAILLVLSPRWDSTFSEHSFGFRPGRSAHDAVAQAQKYLEEGYGWVVDMDLEKFFDRVNQASTARSRPPRRKPCSRRSARCGACCTRPATAGSTGACWWRRSAAAPRRTAWCGRARQRSAYWSGTAAFAASWRAARSMRPAGW